MVEVKILAWVLHPRLTEIPAPDRSQEVPMLIVNWSIPCRVQMGPSYCLGDNPSFVTSHPGTHRVQDFCEPTVPVKIILLGPRLVDY